MTAPTIDDLLDIPTSDAIKTELLSNAAALGLDVTSWGSGDPFRTMLAVSAIAIYAEKGDVRTITAAGFLDDAEGGWLTILAKQVYNVDRTEATYAQDTLSLVNSGGGIYSFDPGEFIVKNSTTASTYANTAAFTLNAASSLDITVRAQTAGTDGNATAGQIDTLVTTLSGVTCANAGAFVATDAELDEDLRQRCRDSLGALSPNGPSAAISYVCKTPSLNGGVTVTRVKVGTPPGDGTIEAWIADAAGAVGPANVALVQSGVDDNATPDFMTVMISSATEHVLSYDVTVYVDQSVGKSDSDWQTDVAAALLAWVPLLPIGGIDLGAGGAVHWRRALGVVENLDGLIQGTFASEADVALASSEVATLSDLNVAVTVVQVSP